MICIDDINKVGCVPKCWVPDSRVPRRLNMQMIECLALQVHPLANPPRLE